MQKITYPLLYYYLKTDAVLGILVNTDYQVVEKNLESVKSIISNHLTQIYKKEDFYLRSNITEPKLKIFEVSIRPTYRTKQSSFPMPNNLQISVPCVYGENAMGRYSCYLPLLNERFFYYDPKQLKTLATHLSTTILNNMPPEQLFRMMLFGEPKLDYIYLRVKNNHSRYYYNWDFWKSRNEQILERLTEAYPPPKSTKNRPKTLPDVAWELEDKVQDVIQKLIEQQASVIIVGNHGVGKSAVLKQVFKRLATQTRKGILDKTFWRIISQRITASAKYLGEWEENCELLVRELKQFNGILWVEDLIQLIRIGGHGAEDSVAAFLLPFLQKGMLQIVGEVTPQELDSMRRFLPGFVENFQIITIKELPESRIYSILSQLAIYSTNNLKIKISEATISLIYRLLARYYPYESFPGKAVKFLGNCISNAQIMQEKTINDAKVIEQFIQQTGLPELFLKDNLLLDQKDLEKYFNSNIIGQQAAIDKMISVVKIFKAGLNNPYKPIQTLIFAGPTGVGKTASAKTLANYFFGKGQQQSPLIRIDMSEFQHPGMIHRFIGSGKQVGKLVQLVREKPFSVLLLDEVEKADSSIFDALLTVLDEGRLVDAYGRVTSFRNTIIIMTTNLGASSQKSIGFSDHSSNETKYLSAISRFFRPEFVNRVDSIVFFDPLDKEAIQQITQKELSDLKRREGFVKRGLDLQFSNTLIEYLATMGFDIKHGARPLQRAIETTLVNPLANWLLQHPNTKNKTLNLDYDNGLKIRF